MSQLHVEAEGDSRASPEILWRLVSDADGYCRWGIWSESAWDRSSGAPPPTPGALRTLRSGRTLVVERILEIEEERRMAYTVVRGIPVRNYRAEVSLTPSGTGTHVRWSAAWDRTLLGRIVHRRLSAVYAEVVSRLVAAADEAVGPED
jgi:uncharacterized protein YndB with AHSA1/START domain